jgi:hypothetical protein
VVTVAEQRFQARDDDVRIAGRPDDEPLVGAEPQHASGHIAGDGVRLEGEAEPGCGGLPAPDVDLGQERDLDGTERSEGGGPMRER